MRERWADHRPSDRPSPSPPPPLCLIRAATGAHEGLLHPRQGTVAPGSHEHRANQESHTWPLQSAPLNAALEGPRQPEGAALFLRVTVLSVVVSWEHLCWLVWGSGRSASGLGAAGEQGRGRSGGRGGRGEGADTRAPSTGCSIQGHLSFLFSFLFVNNTGVKGMKRTKSLKTPNWCDSCTPFLKPIFKNTGPLGSPGHTSPGSTCPPKHRQEHPRGQTSQEHQLPAWF